MTIGPEWLNHDVKGRKGRAAAQTIKQLRARVADRRAWLLRHHQDATREEAANEWACTVSTIKADEKWLGIACKGVAQRRRGIRAPLGQRRADEEQHTRFVADAMRAWR